MRLFFCFSPSHFVLQIIANIKQVVSLARDTDREKNEDPYPGDDVFDVDVEFEDLSDDFSGTSYKNQFYFRFKTV